MHCESNCAVENGRVSVASTLVLAGMLVLASPSLLGATDAPRRFDDFEPNDEFGLATPIVCDSTLQAAVDESGDLDYFLLSGTPGVLALVDIDADSFGSSLNSILGAFETDTAHLAVSNDDPAPGETASEDSYLRLRIPDNGEVYVVVTAFDDFDFDGLSDSGAATTNGPYTLSVECVPPPPPPESGALLGSTGNNGLALIDIDVSTGTGTLREPAGRFGPVTEIEYCDERLFGSTGAPSIIEIDPVTGKEQFACRYDGPVMKGMSCINGQRYGAGVDEFGSAAIVTISDPVELRPTSTFDFSNQDVLGPAVTLEYFHGDHEGVSELEVQLDYTAVGIALRSTFYILVRHLPSATTISAGSLPLCEGTTPCDVDLNWPFSPGNATANFTIPVDIEDGYGDWEIVLTDRLGASNPVPPQGTINIGAVTLRTAWCETSAVGGAHGRGTITALALNRADRLFYGCDGNGRLSSFDPVTGASVVIGQTGIGSCASLAFQGQLTAGSGEDPLLYVGTGGGGNGSLYLLDIATLESEFVGLSGFGALSGLALISGDDLDADGVADIDDNCLLVSNPDQIDSNADNIGNACDADLNNDCGINFSDLGLMKSVFFTADPDADLNGDNAVNFSDLGLMKAAFFTVPGPSGLPNACDDL